MTSSKESSSSSCLQLEIPFILHHQEVDKHDLYVGKKIHRLYHFPGFECLEEAREKIGRLIRNYLYAKSPETEDFPPFHFFHFTSQVLKLGSDCHADAVFLSEFQKMTIREIHLFRNEEVIDSVIYFVMNT